MKRRKDKKFRQLERKYQDEMRAKHRHVEQRVDGQNIAIVAVPNKVRPAPFTPNVKGMRWEAGQLIPRKSKP